MLADKVPFGLITLFFGWMTWHAQPSTNQALNPLVLAVTEFTNLWLLTGLGQYVLYRPAPNPTAWSQTARLAIIISAVLVWALPLLFVRARRPVPATLCYWVLIQMVPPMLLAFMVPDHRPLPVPALGWRMPAAGGSGCRAGEKAASCRMAPVGLAGGPRRSLGRQDLELRRGMA